ncbi:glycosyltransferase family 4 protein [Clostridium sp. 19966]|uniref:glycosyltransferase family 4 protein n=1 Tax=Clostridium sp. 19966 TaxID=2768166 RepID=UPI0028DDB5FF|nr:glycosyltransferase family 1 protein [Clostridium sp. 19966]MDT8715637.1 glycosyltransferase family 4 protein [Clostridium sp. 19966]
MRIAIDARGINWYRGTGIGTYTQNLLSNMLKLSYDNYFHIYWSGDSYDPFFSENSKIIMTSKRHHRFFQQSYIPNNLLKENIDLYHVPQNGIGLSDSINCKKVITVHDLIPYIMPETVGKGYLMQFLKEVPQVIQNCDAIITVSEWSKKDILKFFPINPDKIFVTPLATDMKYKSMDKNWCKYILETKFNITTPYILYVGGFSPRKNVKSLIMAFSKIYNNLDKEHSLVIIGSLRDEGIVLKELTESLGISSKVIFTEFVEEDYLPVLYNAAEVFVYPSLYEGFGLPLLEAMSCGAPVITSDISSIPEVVNDAGILINPYDNSNLIDALGNVLSNETLRNEMSEKGLKRASQYSWKLTADKTLESYSKILQGDIN